MILSEVRHPPEAERTEGGVHLVSLHGDGRPTASAFLTLLTADIAGAELRVASKPDCSPLGAVLAVQLGMGAHRTLPELQTFASKEDVSYRPTMDSGQLEKLKSGWHAAIRAALNA